jgi:hypothetical protein
MKPSRLLETIIKIYLKSSTKALDSQIKSNLLGAKSNLLGAKLFFTAPVYRGLRAVFFTQRVSKRLKDTYSPYATATGEMYYKKLTVIYDLIPSS